MPTNNGNILEVTKSEQYKTVDELFRRSEPNPVYYALLIFSVLIVASGLLLGNGAIVIGGMLVTPLLTPILVVALALLVSEPSAIKGVAKLMLKSFLLVVAGSFFLALIFGVTATDQIFDNSLRGAGLYFIVALASGVAATFAWVRKDIVEILPGIAIAVSLVPPLSLVGIQLSVLNFELSRYYFLVFFLNLVGVIVGSLGVFSALKFYKVGKKIEEKGIEFQGAAAKEGHRNSKSGSAK